MSNPFAGDRSCRRAAGTADSRSEKAERVWSVSISRSDPESFRRRSLSRAEFIASFSVRLSHKFQKLFTRDAAESLWEHACRWIHPVSSRRILGTIDQAELVRLREDYRYRPNARKINAYEDADYWVGVNVKRVQDLWLDRSPPLHILDLGCGPGYFLYLCQMFGHKILGLDADDEPFFRGTTKFFGVSRVVARIHAQAPLPDLGKR